jgi:DNA polymerase elongation subunit (family B)
MKLDIVGQSLFGKGKTEFRPDFYESEYDEFLDDYLFYNYRDVELMVEIERDFNLIEGQQNLQVLAKCQYNSTFYGSSYARVYFMRKADFIQKSGIPQWKLQLEGVTEDDVLQGAIVFDPEELNTIGLHKNVVIVDFAGLYPSMMVSYNTSFETKVKSGEELDDDIIGDGCRFRRQPMGLLPSCVQELDVLRDEYKAKRDIAASLDGKSSTEYRKWDDAQKTVKRLRATFYGLMAFKGYAWGDMDIARTITYGGRTNLMRIAEEAEEMGYKLIYGHTDSCFFALGDDLTPEECAEAATALAAKLTASCQSALKSTAVVVEAELIMDRFYLPRRNRYAGRIIWQPGSGESPFDIANLPVDKRIKMQGLEAKHTNTAEIGRTAQIEAMKLIWDDKPAEDVLDYLRSVVDSVRNGDVPIEDLIARARLGKWLPPTTDHPLYGTAATNPKASVDAFDESDQCYANLGGTQKAAAWYNIVLANEAYPDFDKGDSFYYTFVKGGPTWIPAGGYVGFHDLSQISEYEIDIDLIIEKNIISKLDHILYGIGLSNSLLREGPKVLLKLEDFQ